MADWRVAKSLQVLIGQCNAAWPNRDKAADGTIGDTSHASRKSGHNPNARGVVCAFDLTHDPAHGVDCNHIAEQLRASHDKRIVYLIWNRRIFDGHAGTSPWQWRAYTGTDPHTGHIHLSVGPDVTPWSGGGNYDTYDLAYTWDIGDDVTEEQLKAAIIKVLTTAKIVPIPKEATGGKQTTDKATVVQALTQDWGHDLRDEAKDA